ANDTGQLSIWRSACTPGDTSPLMNRRLISGHSPYEPIVGFSRAVVVDDRVFVAGTAPIPADGSPPPEGAYDQARLCLEIIGQALEKAGARFEDVVRTRVYVTDPAHWQDVGRAHGEVFGEIRPANTTVVTALLDPAWKVEIDVDAVLP
ncbi:MAG: RidA family protein, partial [Gaiellaceae bacterium]